MSCNSGYYCSGIVYISSSTNEAIEGNNINSYGHGIHFSSMFSGTPFSGIANTITYGTGGSSRYNVSLSGAKYP